MNSDFRDKAPVSAAEAATIILDGVRSGAWRIIVGEDAKMIGLRRPREAKATRLRRAVPRCGSETARRLWACKSRTASGLTCDLPRPP